MIDESSLLKSQGSLYLEFIPKDGLFHKMLLLSLMGFLTGWCNLILSQGTEENNSNAICSLFIHTDAAPSVFNCTNDLLFMCQYSRRFTSDSIMKEIED